MYLYSISNGYVETVFFLLFINSIFAVKLRQTEGFDESEKWIVHLIHFANLCCLSDAACLIAGGRVNPSVFYILNALFFITYTAAIGVLFRYMIFRYRITKQKFKFVEYLIWTPFLLIVILAIISYWTGWVFSVSDDGVYTRGPAFYFYFMIGEIYIAGIVVIAFLNMGKNIRNDIKALQPLLFSIPLLITPVVQVFIPYLPITSMGLSVSIIFIFLSNQEVIIKRGQYRTKLLATLSRDFEAIHVADLDKETFHTIKSSDVIEKSNLEQYDGRFNELTESMVNLFVIPEQRQDFLNFLNIDSLKKRMDKEDSFSYRYAINSSETDNYNYEMNFVRVYQDPKKHVLVIGTKCIDDILQQEREEGQYNAALLHDCKYFYEFDVTDGKLRNPIRTSDGYDPFFGEDIKFPIKYDDFNKLRTEKFGIRAQTEQEAKYLTRKGLFEAFNSGKRTVEIRTYSDMTNLYFSITIILTEDLSTHHLHAVFIAKDVTDVVLQENRYKRELEKALEDARKASTAKTDFLSRMSHDIRTPLNGIIGIMDINDKHADDAELVKANRKKARIAAEHLLSLVNDILDMSKFESENTELIKEPLNLRTLVYETLTISGIRAHEAGVKLRHDNGVEILHPDVFGSKLHIKRIFMNILTNGIKYNKAGGEIYCSTKCESDDGERVVYTFQIQDTGIGMSPEYLEHIFEPFSQEKNDARSHYQGSGMGMAIVKALVEKMGGSIRVESEQGVGSTFFITLPFEINHNPVYVEEKETKKSEASLQGKHILIAEDNELNMEIAQIVLKDAGVDVTPAVDGQEAVDIFMKKAPGTFDAILMDIMMPKLDGYSATRKIRNSDKADAATIPIIAMSANAFAEDRKAALDSGMNEHIPKPFNINNLYETVLRLMDKNDFQ